MLKYAANIERCRKLKTLTLFVSTLAALAAFAKSPRMAAESFDLGRVRVTGGVFKEKQDIDREFLLEYMDKHRTDRLLAEFRRVAGLKEKAKRYPGRWEGGGINGHSLGHYLSALSACYAATGDSRAKDRADYIVDELAECQKANGDGYVMTIPQAKVWDKIKAGTFSASGFAICGWWVPNYTIHKVFAGLRDAYRWTGNRKALEVERGLADWYIGVISGLDDKKMQRLLVSEWGGLNETFADLAHDTDDMKYLEVAKHNFDHREIFRPLRAGEDRLDGKHANTQMPKITGLATIYDMTGDESEKTAVLTYWNAVVNDRTLAHGGHSDREHFYPMKDQVAHLGPQTFETCNINNMHRLSSHIFCWQPDSKIADYVERSLINQLVANIGEKPGEFGYFMSTRPVAEKVFSTPEGAWWCCVGTGMENPMRYGEQVYFHDNDGVWVNLYMPTTLDWREKGVKIEQITQFPASEDVEIRVAAQSPVRFALRLRKPFWADGWTINGKTIEADKTGYVAIDRVWDGEVTINVHLPMSERLEELPHSDGKYAAIMRGPVLYVGITPPEQGVEDFAKKRWDDHLAAPAGTTESAPIMVDGEFMPHDVALMPYYKVYEEHYTMYFPKMTQAEWLKHKEKIAREAARLAEIARRTVDSLNPGEQQSEVNHDYLGEGDTQGYWHNCAGRCANGKGWFEYIMAVDPEKEMELAVKYWGSDLEKRSFDILVDGVKIANVGNTKKRMDKFTEITYTIARELTNGKKTVTIRFAADGSDSVTGAIFGVATRFR